MPSKYTLNASLTGHLCQFVADQVASGRFGNASEVVRAGLRLLERDMLQNASQISAPAREEINRNSTSGNSDGSRMDAWKNRHDGH